MLPCERLCELNNAKIRFYNFNKFEEAAIFEYLYVQVMFEQFQNPNRATCKAQLKMNEFQKH